MSFNGIQWRSKGGDGDGPPRAAKLGWQLKFGPGKILRKRVGREKEGEGQKIFGRRDRKLYEGGKMGGGSRRKKGAEQKKVI